MSILERIVGCKRKEVAHRKAHRTIRALERLPLFERKTNSMKDRIEAQTVAIIAEHKRKSPSKGWIAPGSQVTEVVSQYHEAGAAGVSILTDSEFFGGTLSDLEKVRTAFPKLPLLRKDFIIDEYQLLEAKGFGADVVLLIAEILTGDQVRDFIRLAHHLGMETLLEIHQESDLSKVSIETDLLGINNRNLNSFEEKTDHSIAMKQQLEGFCVISESGIRDVETLKKLHASGFDGFLIGEYLMKSPDPGKTLRTLLAQSQGV